MLSKLDMMIKSFNSRTPGGVRQLSHIGEYTHLSVSIHAPREGCDTIVGTNMPADIVSIHAPREGCDQYRE